MLVPKIYIIYTRRFRDFFRARWWIFIIKYNYHRDGIDTNVKGELGPFMTKEDAESFATVMEFV